MRSVLCGIDESGSREAVDAAVDYCLENGSNLRLVGVVEDKLTDSTRSTAGERTRRSKTVRLEVDGAVEVARAAGVTARTTLVAGNMVRELVREAAATGSTDVFYVRSRGPLRSTFTRKARTEVVHIPATASTSRRLRTAA
jgi:Universal stress protein family